MVALSSNGQVAYRGIAGYNAAVREQNIRDAEAKRKADIEVAKMRKYQAENPWWRDQKWKLLSTQIDGATKELGLKTKEYSMLKETGQSDTPRAKQLSIWLTNAPKTINGWVGERKKIEAAYKLQQFYRENHNSIKK